MITKTILRSTLGTSRLSSPLFGQALGHNCASHGAKGSLSRSSRRKVLRHILLAPLVLVFVMLAFTACSSSNAQVQSKPSSKIVVIEIDRSTSYRFTPQALQQIPVLISKVAQDGDIFFLRWINENCYEPGAAIDTIIVPQVPLVSNPNPFNRGEMEEYKKKDEARRKALQENQQFVQQKAEALQKSKWWPVAGSDIFGCLKKAEELLAVPNSEKYLIMATDLEQWGAKKVSFSLQGVHVRVVLFQADDPEQGPKLKSDWTRAFMEAGAADVKFFDPSEPIDRVIATIPNTSR